MKRIKKLAIIGAGAKAAAIVARASALRNLGIADPPEITVFEEHEVGAAWSGKHDYSSGFLKLCTPGEKDVGFPYHDYLADGGSSITSYLFGRFSWSSYQVSNGNFSNWVDRGREFPTHRTWAQYLTWVFRQAEQEIVHARVRSIFHEGDRWKIRYSEPDKSQVEQFDDSFDGVVLTGTGEARNPLIGKDVPASCCFTAQTFWAARNQVSSLEEGTVAIAGDGGAAGIIAAWLAEHFAEKRVAVLCINPSGTLFPRGDGHSERRWFSDPSEWAEMTEGDRRKIIERTEAGVISMRNKHVIDASERIAYRHGKVAEVLWDGEEVNLKIDYNGSVVPRIPCNYFIAAIGFNSWSLLDILEDKSATGLLSATAHRLTVERDMLSDLSLPPISGVPPGLHVPVLAALAHGPGMGNLGCLGLLARAILTPYLVR